MADWTRCTWRTYQNGITALVDTMGYECMVAFKYMFFKGHEEDYVQAKYERPEITEDEFMEDLEELRRKYPDGIQNAEIKPEERPSFNVDAKDSEQVLIRGLIALVNSLGIEGMLEFMAPYEQDDGTYSEGWTKRPEGLAESIIACFRDNMSLKKTTEPVREAEAVLA